MYWSTVCIDLTLYITHVFCYTPLGVSRAVSYGSLHDSESFDNSYTPLHSFFYINRVNSAYKEVLSVSTAIFALMD